MIKKQIVDSLEKLSRGELKALWQHIQFQYVPDFGEKEDEMLRDDIRDKIIELLYTEFDWLKQYAPIDLETSAFEDLDIDTLNIVEFSSTIEAEYEIGFISPDYYTKWSTAEDIVGYIEDNLECALHDMESKNG